MKFNVGYQQPDNGEYFVDILKEYQQNIEEMYFSWVGSASGRGVFGTKNTRFDWSAQQRLEQELCAVKAMGIKLDLLFNSNCYGADAVSISLENEIKSIIDHLGSLCGGPDVVTTTSLTVARTVKREYPGIDVRASVNMKIGTSEAMKYVSGLFDSFCLQRDNQRNLDYVHSIGDWCRQNDKGLYILANSGCLRNCPGQIFHDNMVAHDVEIAATNNIKGWIPYVCHNVLSKQENLPAILQATWVRPEDLHYYEGIFNAVKLATRQHSHPRMVIAAYVNQKFNGNLLNLLEPSFAQWLTPKIIDNALFPSDWFERTSKCNGLCHQCAYCESVFKLVTSD